MMYSSKPPDGWEVWFWRAYGVCVLLMLGSTTAILIWGALKIIGVV